MKAATRILTALMVAAAVAVCSAQTLQVTPLTKDGRILVTLRMNDVFTEDVRTSMHSGLRITFVYDIELKRSTALWVDRTLAATSITASVEYDILKQRYLATRREDGRMENAETIEREEAARAWLTEFDKLPLFSTSMLEGNSEYYLRVRAHTTPSNKSFVWPWEGGIAGLAKFTFLR
ncbi:MAG TPA: DUF4390 domain-containing protein [Vicinamibacterales bacterium]|jgi:hypothetical protein